jgi:hypothetical protein
MKLIEDEDEGEDMNEGPHPYLPLLLKNSQKKMVLICPGAD